MHVAQGRMTAHARPCSGRGYKVDKVRKNKNHSRDQYTNLYLLSNVIYSSYFRPNGAV